MTIQIQIGGELDPLGDAVALALGWATGAGAAEVAGADEVTGGGGELVLTSAEELTVAGGEVVLSLGEELAVRLETALLTPLPTLVPHAVASPAAPSIVTARSRLLINRRIPGPFRGTPVPAFSLASPPSRRVTPNG